ncbi:MAG: DNA repair exonuclease, partial [Candidatus Bathyarchaeia archaeon]
MKIAHLSDTHLGYRAYGRLSPLGVDQREIDVFQTFERVLESIAERQPDLVIHTGDFFHMVRPSNHTIVQAFNRLMRFQKERENKPLVIVAGNHETPRTSDAGCILRLIGNPAGTGNIPGVYVFIDNIEARPLTPKCEIVAVPDRGIQKIPETQLKPQTSASTRLLALHGIVSPLGIPQPEVQLKDIRTTKWTYVALGGYHVHSKVAPNAAYPGAPDYTSSNIWEEARHPKGWLLIETEPLTITFVEVKPTRPVYDLPVIDARGINGKEIAERMMQNALWDDSELPIVRQKVVGADPRARREIPQDSLRTLKARTLYYLLDLSTLTPEPSKDLT